MNYIADLSEDSITRKDFARHQKSRLVTLEQLGRLCDGGGYEDRDHPLWVAREVLEKEIHADEVAAGFEDQPTANLAARYMDLRWRVSQCYTERLPYHFEVAGTWDEVKSKIEALDLPMDEVTVEML